MQVGGQRWCKDHDDAENPRYKTKETSWVRGARGGGGVETGTRAPPRGHRAVGGHWPRHSTAQPGAAAATDGDDSVVEAYKRRAAQTQSEGNSLSVEERPGWARWRDDCPPESLMEIEKATRQAQTMVDGAVMIVFVCHGSPAAVVQSAAFHAAAPAGSVRERARMKRHWRARAQ